MKEFWLEKEECTGCSACANICPKNAIIMVDDECGFKYPKIGVDCIECNMCESVCHNRLKLDTGINDNVDVYAAWSLDEEIRFTSTSGGIFSEIAKQILKSNGCICGAVYNDENLVEHVIVDNEIGVNRLRQSKYIQSNINDAYIQIKKRLMTGQVVAFCGAPCQVAALHAYLGKNYKNLLTIDFICRGMNSPKAYKAWLNEIEEEQESKAVKVWFKYKKNGWKKSPRCTRIDFEDGTNKVYDQNKNLFMCGYLGPNLYIRPSCAKCEFKGIDRKSDITLADFWKIDHKLDDDKGTSLILVNSPKGKNIFESIANNIFYKRMNIEDIMEGNVCFTDSVNINPDSERFLKALDTQKFSKLIKKYRIRLLIRKFCHIRRRD